MDFVNVTGDKHDETLMDVNELFFMNPVSRFQLHGVQENGTSYYLDLENLILILVLLVLRHIDIDGDVIESLVNFTANLYMTGGHCWGIISIIHVQEVRRENPSMVFFFEVQDVPHDRFDIGLLLDKVRYRLLHSPTHQNPISPGQRLALTLR